MLKDRKKDYVEYDLTKEDSTIIKDMYFRRAIELAYHVAKNNDSKVGAVLLNRNKFVAEGINLPEKTHPLQAKYAFKNGDEKRIFLHAEMNCLIQAKQQFDTILVARVKGKRDKNGRRLIGLSRPCRVCLPTLIHFGVKTVWYTTNEETWRREDFNSL